MCACVHCIDQRIGICACSMGIESKYPSLPILGNAQMPCISSPCFLSKTFPLDCRCGNISPNPENAHLQLRDRTIPDADAQCCGQVVGLVAGTSPCHACPSTDLDVRLVYFYDGHTDRCTHIGRHQRSSQHPCELSSRLTDLSRIKTQLLKDGGRKKVLTDIHWITVP